MHKTVNDTDELKEKILDAAEERFRTYGYGKTTMAEIAQDVNMSAANLYRYFQNKQDIAGDCADRCMCRSNEHIRDSIRQPSLSAGERLHTFAIEAYRFNAKNTKESPKINELVEFVSRERSSLVQDKINAKCALIAEILSYGNETGEFDVADVIQTSNSVYTMLMLFDVPIFYHMYTEEEFEVKAKNIIQLLIKGLKKR